MFTISLINDSGKFFINVTDTLVQAYFIAIERLTSIFKRKSHDLIIIECDDHVLCSDVYHMSLSSLLKRFSSYLDEVFPDI